MTSKPTGPSSHESTAALRQAVALEPKSAQAWRRLGDALAAADRLDEAIAVYEQASLLQPASVETHNNLGIALQSAGQLDAAIEAFHRAVLIDPRAHQPRCNLGNALKAADRIEEALLHLRQATANEPRSAEAHNSLGAALEDQGLFAEAIAEYERSLTLDPDFARAHHNLGLALLRNGEFERGWREHEWRWRLESGNIDRRNFPQPRWNGEPLKQRRLLVHAEQGLGDAIQFVRYVPLIKPRFGGAIILAVHTGLRRLFDPMDGVDQLWIDPGLPEFDLHCPLLSLPLIFKTTVETVPAAVPYLHADPALAAHWAARIQTSGHARKIGLAWAGRSDHTGDRARSMPPNALNPLGRIEDATFFSLQKGPGTTQAQPLPAMRLIDLTAEIHDFADTAAFIQNLDLIISVDTAVAHLAGAMGKPVWVLIPFVPDWRWMLNRSDSPWYPTMRLFRQTEPGNWFTPIGKIVEAMRHEPRGI